MKLKSYLYTLVGLAIASVLLIHLPNGLSVSAKTTTTTKSVYMLTTKNLEYITQDEIPDEYIIEKNTRHKVKTISTYDSKTKKTKVISRTIAYYGQVIPVKSTDVKKIVTRPQVAFEKEVVRLVNIERSKRKLKPLVVDSSLTYTAYTKSKDMYKESYFSHDEGTYGNYYQFITRNTGTNISYVGENIAYGQLTPKEVMNDWIHSPKHKANILDKDFKRIGVGIYKDPYTKALYWTQHFIAR